MRDARKDRLPWASANDGSAFKRRRSPRCCPSGFVSAVHCSSIAPAQSAEAAAGHIRVAIHFCRDMVAMRHTSVWLPWSGCGVDGLYACVMRCWVMTDVPAKATEYERVLCKHTCLREMEGMAAGRKT